jgi:hypothetical protein
MYELQFASGARSTDARNLTYVKYKHYWSERKRFLSLVRMALSESGPLPWQPDMQAIKLTVCKVSLAGWLPAHRGGADQARSYESSEVNA